MKIPAGTRIYAVSEDEQPGSFAIIQFEDLSMFQITSGTMIEIKPEPNQISNLELIVGKIWVNMQRRMAGQSLKVRTERSVIGIKGTIFILEEDGVHTTLKVIEGVVTFTSLADGNVLEVTAGQKI